MTTLHMPVIGPPPTATAADAHYRTVSAATRVRAAPVAHDGVQITLSNASFNRLFAMTGGLLHFVPPGRFLFPRSPEVAPAPGGALLLQVGPPDYQLIRQTRGLPRVAYILYFNLQPDSVRRALGSRLQDVLANTPRPMLMSVWPHPRSPRNDEELGNNWLDVVARGERALFVPSGAEIGDAAASAGGVQFTLRFVGSRAGSGGAAGEDVSPVLHIRNMPAHGDGGAARWAGHPLISAVSGISLPVNIYAKFEVWNATSRGYTPLPRGVRVSLMDYDPVTPNDELGVRETDDDGRVHFHYSNLAALEAIDEATPDIFFLVHTNGIRHAGHTLPHEWSTKGWRDIYGNPGYFEEYDGRQLGNEDSPLIYRVGLDVHLKLEYRDETQRPPVNAPAPPKIPVSLIITPGVLNRGNFFTDGGGEIHAVIFDIEPGVSIYFEVRFQMTDPAIHLPLVFVSGTGWETNYQDADTRTYPDWDRTTIGTYNSSRRAIDPDVLRATAENRNVALYFLKIVREWSTFLFHITGGAWAGVARLDMGLGSPTRSYSWPVGSVNIHPDDFWDRQTIIHELSHQIMWQEANYSSLGIAVDFVTGRYHHAHAPAVVTNPETALIEGWADFIAGIFERSRTPPSDLTGVSLGPAPATVGEVVEGAFTNGLWQIFQNLVVTSSISPDPRISATTNGIIPSSVVWFRDPNVRDRFLSMIWRPLQDMRPHSNPTTSLMINAIRLRNLARWHELLAELQMHFLNAVAPAVTSINPATGPAGAEQDVTISGGAFAAGASLTVDGVPAIRCDVTDSSTISARIPRGTTGPADVVVTTRAGSGRLARGYTYS